MIWDRICRPWEGTGPVEGWGGISYSLEAFAVALPSGWMARPILRLGEDLADDAWAYLSSIPGLDMAEGIQVTPGINPRVELRYQDRKERLEVPTGEVPPWEWADLEPLVGELDAIYVNFITGRELTLETSKRLGKRFLGPLYADLHTLFTEISSSGIRFLRTVQDWQDWLRAFDVVQMNQEEFRLIGGSGAVSSEGAANLMSPGPGLIAVTMGSQGVSYLSKEGFDPDPSTWPATRGVDLGEGWPGRGSVPAPMENFLGDPTGCGDVWGATFFARLLAGESIRRAMATANRLAYEKMGHRGARGLHRRMDLHAGGT